MRPERWWAAHTDRPVEALRLSLRAYCLASLSTAWQPPEGLEARLGPRRVAEIALQEADWLARRLPGGSENVPECVRRNIGVIGMKALASGIIPAQLKIDATLARRFALTLPISTLVCGIRSQKDLHQDLALARNFQPLTQKATDELLARTKTPGRDGKLEPFKTTKLGSAYHARQHEGV